MSNKKGQKKEVTVSAKVIADAYEIDKEMKKKRSIEDAENMKLAAQKYLSSLSSDSDKAYLALRITGYGRENSKNIGTTGFIRNLLRDNNLTFKDAYKIINDMREVFSPEFRNKTMKEILLYLKSDPEYKAKSKTNNNHLFNLDSTDIKTGINFESENTFIKGVPLLKTYKHFEIFTKSKSNNGKNFLTDEQLKTFFCQAFIKGSNRVEKIKFNYVRGEKGKIIKIFYDFFDYCAREHNQPNATEKYIKLITDNFDNLGPESSIKSFFKPNKIKTIL